MGVYGALGQTDKLIPRRDDCHQERNFWTIITLQFSGIRSPGVNNNAQPRGVAEGGVRSDGNSQTPTASRELRGVTCQILGYLALSLWYYWVSPDAFNSLKE
jgi:hypothetical protein